MVKYRLLMMMGVISLGLLAMGIIFQLSTNRNSSELDSDLLGELATSGINTPISGPNGEFIFDCLELPEVDLLAGSIYSVTQTIDLTRIPAEFSTAYIRHCPPLNAGCDINSIHLKDGCLDLTASDEVDEDGNPIGDIGRYETQINYEAFCGVEELACGDIVVSGDVIVYPEEFICELSYYDIPPSCGNEICNRNTEDCNNCPGDCGCDNGVACVPDGCVDYPRYFCDMPDPGCGSGDFIMCNSEINYKNFCKE